MQKNKIKYLGKSRLAKNNPKTDKKYINYKQRTKPWHFHELHQSGGQGESAVTQMTVALPIA